MPSMRVIEGGLAGSDPDGRPSAIRAAFEHFRLDRQANLAAASTLKHYDAMIEPFLGWLGQTYPHVRRFEQLDVDLVREYRVAEAQRVSKYGRPLSPATLHDTHRLLRTFLGWAADEGYAVDLRILRMKGPKVPVQEATVFHLAQLRTILSVCKPGLPQEEMVVRLLVGSGLRVSEACGLSLRAPDGLSDVMLDSLERGRVELRVRWDSGAKGRKSRRVPITPRLAAHLKRYEARHRRGSHDRLLSTWYGTPFTPHGLDSMMLRLQTRAGFRVHAHAFRHTFATVATKMGWNFELLRAAMGHADYTMLQRYTRLAAERDLGALKEWSEFVVSTPVVE